MNFKVLFFDSSVNANSLTLQIRFLGGYREKEIPFPDALKFHHENQADFKAVVRVVNWNSELVVFDSVRPIGLEEMYAGGYIAPIYEFMTRFFDQEVLGVLLDEFADEIREEWEEAAEVEEEDLNTQAMKDFFRGLHI